MALTRRQLLAGSGALAIAGCAPYRSGNSGMDSAVAAFEQFDAEFSAIVDTDAPGQLLGEGYGWAEGPAWDHERSALYFTDVPANRAYRWHKRTGVEVFLEPSGVAPEDAGGLREPGANGLLLSRDGSLLICNHGKRAIEKLDFATGTRTILADRFEGKRFNSPNDVIEASNGTIYFTDPPYGMEGLNDSPLKEMTINGVYRLTPGGTLSRIVEDMTFPNGVALSPSEDALYIAQSDPQAPLVRKLTLDGDMRGREWFDARPFMEGHSGLPDGMAVAETGHVFLAGPGGVLVIDSDANCLGRIGTGRATANCAFGEDGRTLFITAQNRLLSVRTKVKGIGRFAL